MAHNENLFLLWGKYVIILLGYKGYVIKEFFNNYLLHSNSLTIDFTNNTTKYLSNLNEKWKVTLLDTGSQTMTGGRIKQPSQLWVMRLSF